MIYNFIVSAASQLPFDMQFYNIFYQYFRPFFIGVGQIRCIKQEHQYEEFELNENELSINSADRFQVQCYDRILPPFFPKFVS